MREKYCNNCERVLRNFEELQSRLAECEANRLNQIQIDKEAFDKENNQLLDKLAAAENLALRAGSDVVIEQRENAELLQWCERFQGLLKSAYGFVQATDSTEFTERSIKEGLAEFEAWKKERNL